MTSLLLVGKLSLLPGLVARLTSELKALQLQPLIHALPQREHLSWLGASAWAAHGLDFDVESGVPRDHSLVEKVLYDEKVWLWDDVLAAFEGQYSIDDLRIWWSSLTPYTKTSYITQTEYDEIGPSVIWNKIRDLRPPPFAVSTRVSPSQGMWSSCTLAPYPFDFLGRCEGFFLHFSCLGSFRLSQLSIIFVAWSPCPTTGQQEYRSLCYAQTKLKRTWCERYCFLCRRISEAACYFPIDPYGKCRTRCKHYSTLIKIPTKARKSCGTLGPPPPLCVHVGRSTCAPSPREIGSRMQQNQLGQMCSVV